MGLVEDIVCWTRCAKYVEEMLLDSGNASSVRQRHAGWFLQLAEAASERKTAPDKAAWLQRVGAEYANILAALDYCLGERERGEWALKMGSALSWFWTATGRVEEGRERISAALAPLW